MLPAVLVDLLRSKKFVLAVIAASLTAAGKLGLNLSSETVGAIVGPLWLALVGYAAEDHGKAAAKVVAGMTVEPRSSVVVGEVKPRAAKKGP